jgi:hypothetical protein
MNRWPNNNIKSAILSKKLLCYESFSFSPYQFSNTDCFNGILTATNEKQTTENIYLYPNPANDRDYKLTKPNLKKPMLQLSAYWGIMISNIHLPQAGRLRQHVQ